MGLFIRSVKWERWDLSARSEVGKEDECWRTWLSP